MATPPPPNQITLEWNLVRLKATSAPVMWQSCLIGATNLLSSMTLTWENTQLFTSVCSLRAPGSIVFPPLTGWQGPWESRLEVFEQSTDSVFRQQETRSHLVCWTTKPLRRCFWKHCVSARGHNPCELHFQLWNNGSVLRQTGKGELLVLWLHSDSTTSSCPHSCRASGWVGASLGGSWGDALSSFF